MTLTREVLELEFTRFEQGMTLPRKIWALFLSNCLMLSPECHMNLIWCGLSS